MNVELITKNDLQSLKDDILSAVAGMIQLKPAQKEWLKSSDVRKMLDISPGTLQTLRVSGILPFTKIGGTIYYKQTDVEKILESNRRGGN